MCVIQARVTDLEPEAKYRFDLRAKITSGAGDPSEVDVTALPEQTAVGGERQRVVWGSVTLEMKNLRLVELRNQISDACSCWQRSEG